jgi:hypothetical protein
MLNLGEYYIKIKHLLEVTMSRLIAAVIVLFVFTTISQAEPVWPLEVGQVWVYEAYDSQGNVVPEAERRAVVSGIVTRDSEVYYIFGDGYFRSTDTEIYEWDDDTNDQELFFTMGSVGDSWSNSTDNTVEILDTDFTVDIPYGLGNYSSYELEYSDPSGVWYIYIVPGLGLVQDDERFDADTPNYIYKLKNIYTPNSIEAILDFVDDSVEDGTLTGDGPGNSGNNRLNALVNMLEEAQGLIEAGMLEDACNQLWSAYRKCDGNTRPPDFVKGNAADDLANMILNVMDDLGC